MVWPSTAANVGQGICISRLLVTTIMAMILLDQPGKMDAELPLTQEADRGFPEQIDGDSGYLDV